MRSPSAPSTRPSGSWAARARAAVRRPRPVDVLVVVALLVLSLEPLRTPADCGCGTTPAWGYALVVTECVVLLWRRSAPFTTALLTGLLTAVHGISSVAEPVVPFAGVVGLYTAAALATRQRALVAAALAVVGIAAALLLDPAGPPDLQDVTVNYLVFATAWLLGDSVRSRREEVAALQRTRVAWERQAVADERASIARELHDVVAHSVGLMVVQAEAGAVLSGTDPARAEPAFDAIGRTGREALTELRQLLGVLRDDRGEPGDRAGRSPQPGLAVLPALTGEVASAGLDVELVVHGQPRPVPPAVDLSAYRIAQEALTNVLRHAGARSAQVVVDWSATDVRVTVTDDGRPGRSAAPPAGQPAQGRGLVGMRERAALVGGDVQAGPDTDGGWRVCAVLPTALPTATSASIPATR